MPRQYVGPQVLIRMPEDMIAALDEAATAEEMSRPELARTYIAEGLARRERAERRAAARAAAEAATKPRRKPR